jgi:chromosome partitioning protein
MPVLAIINAKGGSGKSTVATSISAYAAKVGIKLILGDLDPQQSIRTWLRLRPTTLPAISGWLLDAGRVFRTPVGVTHAILDTPSGLCGHHLARVVMSSNLVIVPVAASAFDRDAAEVCIENMRRMPRVVSGLCVIAILGMRIPQGSSAERTTRAWAAGLGIKFLGVIRYSPLYITLVDEGSSVFDDARKDAAGLRNDWKPLLDWLGETYFGTVPKPDAKRETRKMVNDWPCPNPKLAANEKKDRAEVIEPTFLSSAENFSDVVGGPAVELLAADKFAPAGGKLDSPVASYGFFASVKKIMGSLKQS